MDAVGVEELFDFFVWDVVGDETDVFRHGFGSVFLALDDGQEWPFGVFVPEFQDSFCAFEGASSCEMKKRLVVFLGVFIQHVGGCEADEFRGAVLGKYLFGVVAFAEDVVDFF